MAGEDSIYVAIPTDGNEYYVEDWGSDWAWRISSMWLDLSGCEFVSQPLPRFPTNQG
jgi:hypothetical protein